MIRRLLLAAAALVLLPACVSEVREADPGALECACPGESIVFHESPPGPIFTVKVTGCSTIELVRTSWDVHGPKDETCTDAVAACGATGVVTTDAVAKALAHPEVKLALATSKVNGRPTKFGLFAPDVWDWPEMSVVVDGAEIDVGYPYCHGEIGCTVPTDAITTAFGLLANLRAAVRAETTCDAALGPDPTYGP
jgi:hypothetical protein